MMGILQFLMMVVYTGKQAGIFRCIAILLEKISAFGFPFPSYVTKPFLLLHFFSLWNVKLFLRFTAPLL